MHNTLQMIELADVLAADRLRPVDGYARRAGPGLRARIGHRVIALGELIAAGSGHTVTR